MKNASFSESTIRIAWSVTLLLLCALLLNGAPPVLAQANDPDQEIHCYPPFCAPIATGNGDDRVFVENGGKVIFGVWGYPALVTGIETKDGDDLIVVRQGGAIELMTDRAVAIDSGSGDDEVENAGLILVHVPHPWGTFVTSAWAKGILTGDGDDQVTNTASGEIHVNAFAEGPSGSAVAVGMDTGAGDDRVENGGYFHTFAMGTQAWAGGFMLGEGDNVFVNSDRADIWAQSGLDSEVLGIESGAGNDSFTNTGTLDFDAWGWFSDSTAVARGIDAGDGDNEVFNYGSFRVDASAGADVWVQGIAAGSGADTFVNTGEFDVVGLTDGPGSSVLAEGILFGDGANGFLNDGWFQVAAGLMAYGAESIALGIQTGSGDDTITNNGSFNVTTSGQDVAETRGVVAGDGDNTIVNSGWAWFYAGAADATTSAIQSGEGDDAITSEGYIGVLAQGLTADATGIDAGDGDNTIEFKAGTGAEVNAFEVGATGRFEAEAIGVRTGVGDDEITNEVSFDVDAHNTFFFFPGQSVHAAATGIDAGDGDNTVTSTGSFDVAANDSMWGHVDSSEAWGILTGDGNDTITLDGWFGVRSYAMGSSLARGVTAGDGNNVIDNFGTMNVRGFALDIDAFGIETGAGDDEITNDGLLNVYADGNVAFAAGISAGDGDNVVSLGGWASNGQGLLVGAYSWHDGESFGVRAGDGDDSITNAGSFSVWSQSGLWDGESDTTGIFAGDGDNEITNTGEMKIRSLSHQSWAVGIQSGAGSDTITNAGSFSVESDSEFAYGTSDATGIFAGDGDNEIANTGEMQIRSYAYDAWAIGIHSGAGSDTITNDGLLRTDVKGYTATAHGIFAGDGDNTVKLSGTSGEGQGFLVNVLGTATGSAAGVETGTGNDTITNDGYFSLTAWAGQASGWGIGDAGGDNSIVLGGGPDSDSRFHVSVCGATDADAFGILTGDGDDEISNQGAFSVYADTYWIGVADATGIFAGDGANTLGNSGTMNVTANAYEAEAIGMMSGLGGDVISNDGRMVVGSNGFDAQATGIDAGDGDNDITLSGSFDDDAGLVVSAAGGVEMTAMGVESGSGADTIFNDGNISVSADAWGWDDDYSVGSAYATVISAGDGDNRIESLGNVWATADGFSESVAIGFETGSGADTVISAGDITVTSSAFSGNSYAGGILVGDGEDSVVNDCVLTVDAQNDYGAAEGVGIYGESDRKVITNNSTIDVRAWGFDAVGRGIVTGDGDDTVHNDNLLLVDVFSWSPVVPDFGPGRAYGIDTGTGDDTVTNSVGIDVNLATPNSDAVAAGIRVGEGDNHVDSGGDIVLYAGGYGLAEAYAIEAGAGNDTIASTGSVSVKAESQGDAVGIGITAGSGVNAITTGGSLTVLATGSAAQATGVLSGAGNDSVVNDGTFAIQALGNEATAVGVQVGDGSNSVTNGGDVTLYAEGAEAYVAGIVTGAGDDDVVSTGSISMLAQGGVYGEATGIAVSGGDNSVLNEGDLSVTAMADSGSTMLGGIYAGGGQNEVRNTGTIEVQALASPGAFLDSSFSHGIETLGGDDTIVNEGTLALTTQVEADHVGAVAIYAGGGANEITNSGDISVLQINDNQRPAAAELTGIYAGGGDDTITNSGTLTLESVHQPGDVSVVAIDTGDGDNVVNNDGQISVMADGASMTAAGIATGSGNDVIANDGTIDIDGSAEWDYVDESHVCAIATGDGDDTIVNNGTITSTFWRPDGSGSQPRTENAGLAIDSGSGNDTVTLGSGSMTQGFIVTGDGDDTVINAGTVSVATSSNTASALGVAIDTGSGNDTVVLENGSVTEGSVDTGDGDDTVTFQGNAVLVGVNTGGSTLSSASVITTPLVSGGDGQDTIVLQDVSVCAVESLAGFENFELNEGMLEFSDASYGLADTGMVQVTINNENQNTGQLCNVDGEIVLDGMLYVDAAPWVYQDGDSFDVVFAGNGLSGSFDQIVLPDSTLFVDFTVQEHSDVISVQTDVRAFSSEADNKVERGVTAALDAALPTATGDFSRVLGELQLVTTAAQAQQGFNSLSPAMYDNLSRGALDVVRLSLESTEDRLDLVRSKAEIWEWETRTRPTPKTRQSAGPSALFRTGDAWWVKGIGLSGEQDPGEGYEGHEIDTNGAMAGYERVMRRGLVGGAIGTTNSDVDLSGKTAYGQVDTTFASFYMGRVWRPAFLQSVVSYSDHEYTGNRAVDINNLSRQARADYDGSAISMLLTLGFELRQRDWTIEPFATARFISLDEDGFQETGADSANLILESRESESLMADAGLRVARTFERGGGARVTPEFMLSWTHDFDADGRNLTAAYLGSPTNSFGLQGQAIEEDGLNFAAGLAWFTKSGFETSLRYMLWDRSDYQSDSLSIHFGLGF